MYKRKTFFAVIPARGGSKRLSRKNIRDLAGKPLISWTIEAAKNSKYIDHIVVSTDDREIADVSMKCKAKVLMRPNELATDTTNSTDVVMHAIEKQNINYDYVILLQPTSPLRTSEHIDEAIELLISKNASVIISVCETDHSPLWSNTLPEDGSMNNFIKEEYKDKRSQDLPIHYRLNGAIYIAETKLFKRDRKFKMGVNTLPYVMERSKSIDIDSHLDFMYAKCIIENSV